MIDEIYEVTKNDYDDFIYRLKSDYSEKITNHYDDRIEVHYYSKDLSRHFAACITTSSNEEGVSTKYYIIEMPQPNELGKNRVVRRITLSDEEDIKNFFQALNADKNKKV